MSNARGKRNSPSLIKSPLVLVTLAALAIRVAVLWWRNGNDPFFLQPINDSAVYLAWARALIAGTPFGIPGAPFHLAPFYPYLLSFILPLGKGSIWAVMIIQAVMGSLTVLGTGMLAHHLAGQRAGWIAAVLVTICGPMLWYEGWLLPTTLNLLLLVIGLNLLAAIADPRRWGGYLPALAGLVLGLAAVNRPQQMLVVAAGVVWLFFMIRRESSRPGKGIRRWQPVLLLSLGAVLAMAPVTFRNLAVSGEPVVITANAGLNFYSGNHPGANGRFGLPAGFSPYIQDQQRVSRELAWKQSGSKLDWQEVSSHWFGKAGDGLLSSPGSSLMLALQKIRLSLAWREMENNFVAGWVHRHLGPGQILFPSMAFLWILAMPGMLEALKKRDPALGPLWIMLVSTLVVCILFWVSTRNRLPLVIPLAVFSAMALARPGLWKKPGAVVAAAGMAILVLWPTGEGREGAGFYVDLGRVHAVSGDHLAAREDFLLALEIEPETPMATNGLALTYMEEGNRKKAVFILKDLLKRYPDFEYARRNLEAIQRSAPARTRPVPGPDKP